MIASTLAATALFCGTALLHADHEKRTCCSTSRLARTAFRIAPGKISRTRQRPRVVGSPRFLPCGPTEALVFTGDEYLSLGKDYDDAKKLLPPRAMTAAAWVRLDELTERGGLVGYIGGSRASQQGWLLGYNQSTFVYALSAKG